MNIAKRLINVLMVLSIIFFLPFVYGFINNFSDDITDNFLRLILGIFPFLVLLLINYISVGECKLFHSIKKTSEIKKTVTSSQDESSNELIGQLKKTIEEERITHSDKIMKMESDHLDALDKLKKNSVDLQRSQPRNIQIYASDIIRLLINDYVPTYDQVTDDIDFNIKVSLKEPLTRLELVGLNEYTQKELKNLRAQKWADDCAKEYSMDETQKKMIFDFFHVDIESEDETLQDCIDRALTSKSPPSSH